MFRLHVHLQLSPIRDVASTSSCNARRHPAIPPSPVELVRPAQARFAMAPGARRLSRMAVGNNVAANASGGSAGALSRVCEEVSLGTASGEGTRVLRFGCLERARLLPPRQNVAPRGLRNSFETPRTIS